MVGQVRLRLLQRALLAEAHAIRQDGSPWNGWRRIADGGVLGMGMGMGMGIRTETSDSGLNGYERIANGEERIRPERSTFRVTALQEIEGGTPGRDRGPQREEVVDPVRRAQLPESRGAHDGDRISRRRIGLGTPARRTVTHSKP